MKKIRQMLCRHKWAISRKVSDSMFASISGEQLYQKCEKCGKVKEYVYREYEGTGYK